MPEPEFPPIKLIVGLGNPGREYEKTRHNVGFMVLDRLALAWRFGFADHSKWKSALGRHSDFHFLKPLTFMNISGQAIQSAAQFYKISPAEILLIYDDISLPLGKIRLRPSGSAGGHNGIKSTIQHLGTDQFPRIKIGIGGAEQKTLTGHVLGKFTPEEQETLDKSLDRAVEAVKLAALRGWASAMHHFNTEEKPKAASPPVKRPAAKAPAPAEASEPLPTITPNTSDTP